MSLPRLNESAEPPSATRLLSAPLPDVLAEVGAVLVEVDLADERFLGAAYDAPGRLVLAISPACDDEVRDVVARVLIGRMLGVPLPDLPDVVRAERA